MKILMISLDKTLLGEKVSAGDAVRRHRKYGQFVDVLNIIVLSKKGYKSEQLSDNVFIYPTNSKNKLNYIKDALRIGEAIYQEEPFGLVISQDPFLTGLVGVKLKNKLGVKLLVHFHGDFWGNKFWLKEKWYNYFLLCLSRFIVKKADGIRVVSRGIRRKLRKKGVKSKIETIPTPVDLEKFEKFDPEKVSKIKEKYQNEKIILFVGRLEKEKNLNWFLKVFKDIKQEYNNVQFLIIGEGGQKESLKLKIKNLKLDNSVKFIGRVEHNDLTNYYHISDVVVLPSTSESFGKVLVEAGISSKPVVATKTTGAQDIVIDQKTGFLVPINNQKQMREKILKLLKDEKLAQEMGQQAQKYVKENFGGDVLIKKIIRFWEELIFG